MNGPTEDNEEFMMEYEKYWYWKRSPYLRGLRVEGRSFE